MDREDKEAERAAQRIARERRGGTSAAAVLKRACPTCGAPPGQRCMSPASGKRPASPRGPHTARKALT